MDFSSFNDIPIGIYIVGLDLQDAASQSLDQFKKSVLQWDIEPSIIFAIHIMISQMGAFYRFFFHFYSGAKNEDDEYEEPSSSLVLADDIRDFVQDSIDEDSYENEYSYDYGARI